jgi:hypothetical protein
LSGIFSSIFVSNINFLLSYFVLLSNSFVFIGYGYNVSIKFFSKFSSILSFLSGDKSSSITSCIAFLAFALEAGSSTSSSELEHPSSESASSSPIYLIWLIASAANSFNKFLFNESFLHYQNALSTYFPTFIRSPILKCLPERNPLLAPANEASSVNTKGILS